MAASDPFKRCSTCLNKIPLSDGHSQCLFCLGKEHQPALCVVCKGFTKPALKLRLQRLRFFLWEKSLCPARDSAIDPLQVHSAKAPSSAGPSPKGAKKVKRFKMDEQQGRNQQSKMVGPRC